MTFFDLLWAYILVFLLAALPFIESYVIIPIAIVGGLSPVPVFLLAFLGNLATVYLVILFINQIREWRRKRKGNEAGNTPEKRTQRAQRLWKKFGLPGLTLIGPFFVGTHLTAFMSIVLGGSRKLVAIWITVSLLIWSLIFALLGHFGVGYLNIDYPFIEKLFSK